MAVKGLMPEVPVDGGGVRQVQVQFQNDIPAVEVETQISESTLGPFSILDDIAVDVGVPISAHVNPPLSSIDPADLEAGSSGRTNHQISLSEHNTGMVESDIVVDVGALMSAQVNPYLSNIDQILGFEISLPEGPAQNTGSPGDGLGPTRSNWIRWSVPLDAFNFVSNAMASVFVNNFPGDLTDVVHLIINRSNGIRQLVFLAGCNFFFNTLVGVNYLNGELQEAHGRNWRAELIASVGAPIAVAVFTLLSSFRFASDPEGWSNWITELSRVNAAMIGGGPLAFYGMRNLGTEN